MSTTGAASDGSSTPIFILLSSSSGSPPGRVCCWYTRQKGPISFPAASMILLSPPGWFTMKSAGEGKVSVGNPAATNLSSDFSLVNAMPTTLDVCAWLWCAKDRMPNKIWTGKRTNIVDTSVVCHPHSLLKCVMLCHLGSSEDGEVRGVALGTLGICALGHSSVLARWKQPPRYSSTQRSDHAESCRNSSVPFAPLCCVPQRLRRQVPCRDSSYPILQDFSCKHHFDVTVALGEARLCGKGRGGSMRRSTTANYAAAPESCEVVSTISCIRDCIRLM